MVPRGFTGKVKKDEMDIKKKMVTGTGRKSSFEIFSACIIVLACADAYLTPCIKRYVDGFAAGFQNGIEVRMHYVSFSRQNILQKLFYQLGMIQ